MLVRADAGGASKAFLHHVTDAGLHYSVGFPAHGPVQTAIATIPEHAWVAALDSDGTPREGAQIAELTDWMPAPVKPTRSPAQYGPQEWPPGMRVIARRERPHPGAQLRLTDHNGWRITCFATNTRGTGWTLPTLEVRHRQRARSEDRIRCLKDTGLRNLPFHNYQANRIWLEVIALAADLIAWTQTLAFDDHQPARQWEPKRVRFRLLAVAGRLIRTGRRCELRLPRDWPWTGLIRHRLDPSARSLNTNTYTSPPRTRRAGDHSAGDHPPPTTTTHNTTADRADKPRHEISRLVPERQRSTDDAVVCGNMLPSTLRSASRLCGGRRPAASPPRSRSGGMAHLHVNRPGRASSPSAWECGDSSPLCFFFSVFEKKKKSKAAMNRRTPNGCPASYFFSCALMTATLTSVSMS